MILRFPDGQVEWRFPADALAVGDQLRRGDQVWVVESVEDEGEGDPQVVAVTLRPVLTPVTGMPASIDTTSNGSRS